MQSSVVFSVSAKSKVYKPSIHRRQSSYHSRLEQVDCRGTPCRRHPSFSQTSESQRSRAYECLQHNIRWKWKTILLEALSLKLSRNDGLSSICSKTGPSEQLRDDGHVATVSTWLTFSTVSGSVNRGGGRAGDWQLRWPYINDGVTYDVESDAIFCRVKTYCCCWHFICAVVTSYSDLVDELCVFVVDATILKDRNQISVYIMHIVSCK